MTQSALSRAATTVGRLTIAAALVVAAVAGVWIAVIDDPDAGRPVVKVAVADLEPASPPVTGSLRTVSPQSAPVAGSVPAGVASPAADPALLEASPFGSLPRMSPDGRRAREVYAGRSTGGTGLRIAIVVGGLGLSQTGTLKALDTLPPQVTLAFAPYGSSLQRWADKARGAGHELILQLPLEADGNPAAAPGEHTLTVSESGDVGQEDLHWLLGRMTGYAGAMNYLGARFLPNDRATATLVGELGSRGLYFLDDGSTPDSRAPGIGATLQMPVLRADAVVDAERASERIVSQLMALEDLARRNGSALGVATAFPATVDAVATWAHDAAGRGVHIVPASALIGGRAVAAQ